MLMMSLQATASPDEINNKFYLGTSVGSTAFTISATPTASIFAGYIWDNFSAEIGYTKLATEEWFSTTTIGGSAYFGLAKYRSQNFYTDVGYTYPLTQKLGVKACAGLGIFDSKVYSAGDGPLSLHLENGTRETAAGFRAGASLEYRLAKSWTANISYTMQTNPYVLKGWMDNVALGLKYYI